MRDDALLRSALFFGTLALLLALEGVRARRAGPMHRRLRWPSNLGLAAINAACVALLPLASVGVAVLAQQRGWGLLNALGLAPWLEIGLAWLLLDLAIYWQHRWMHELRWLWPLHRVHHSDVELDATTGVRFHPAEILLSLAWKSTLIVALGAPPPAALLLELGLNLVALWSHANLRLPTSFERRLRWLLITPDMHRVHHSVHRRETDSNYSNTMSFWDRLFGSYVAQPADGHEAMRIGLPVLRAPVQQQLPALLAQPLRRESP